MDTFFQDLSAVMPLEWGALGARFSYINFGSFDTRNESGILQGSTSPMAWGADIGIAKRFENVSFGISGKYYQESYSNYSLNGFGFDAGGLARFDHFSFALGARDLGTASGYAVPTNYYVGAALSEGTASSIFNISTDATMTAQQTVALHHGLEYGFHEFLYLRAGYQWEPQQASTQDQVGFGGGFGVVFENFKLDYSLVPYGELGLTHKISLGYEFGDSKKKDPETETSSSKVN